MRENRQVLRGIAFYLEEKGNLPLPDGGAIWIHPDLLENIDYIALSKCSLGPKMQLERSKEISLALLEKFVCGSFQSEFFIDTER